MNIALKHFTENYKPIATSTKAGGVTEIRKMGLRTFTDARPVTLTGDAPPSSRITVVIDKQ